MAETGFAAIPDATALRARQRARCPASLARRPAAASRRRRACAPPTSSSPTARSSASRRPARETDAPRGRPRPAAWCWPAFVDMPHPHRQGPHLAAHAQPRRHLHVARSTPSARDRERDWSAEDVARRMDFCAPLRLRARHRRAPHPPRFARRRRRRSPGRSSRRCASAGRAASSCRRVSLVTIEQVRDERLVRRRSPTASPRAAACSAPSPSWCPTSSALLDDVVRARGGSRARPRFPRRRDRRPGGAVSLDRIADAVLRNRFPGPHRSSAIAARSRSRPTTWREATLDKVAEAGISVVSLPMCNMYLQDRRTDGTTPRWRGVTLLHEMKARGIRSRSPPTTRATRSTPMATSTCWRSSARRRASCISTTRFGDWAEPRSPRRRPRSSGAARIIGVIGAGRAGRLHPLPRPRPGPSSRRGRRSDRIVIRAGRRASTRTLPDYRELDDLVEVGHR